MLTATKVHVDAKIINRDTEDKPKRTLVAYVIADSDDRDYDEVKAGDSSETDAAELYAIDFVFRKLKDREGRFVLLCDNESVVKVLHRSEEQFRRKARDITKKVWHEIHESMGKFEIEHFPHNQADSFLNLKWKEIKDKS